MTPVQLQGLDAELSHDVMFDAEPPTAVLILRSAWTVMDVLSSWFRLLKNNVVHKLNLANGINKDQIMKWK